MRVIRDYLLREILALFSLSLAIITMLFMSQRIIQLTEWAINKGIGPADIVKFMGYRLPEVLLIVVPMVTLFSILLAVGRLSGDNEIVALKASGVSLFKLYPPIVLFAAFGGSLALFTTQVLAPRAIRASRILEYRIVQTKTDAAISERVFMDLMKGSTFYIREKRPDGELLGILAAMETWRGDSTWQDRRIVFARSGRFAHDPYSLTNELWLMDGIMISEDRANGRDDFARFETARFRIDLSREKVSLLKEIKEFGFFDMYNMLTSDKPLHRNVTVEERARREMGILMQERLAWPLGCLALCFWAIPLGIQPPRAGRARSIVVSVLLAAAFYYLMILGRFMALKDYASPQVAIWIPNLVIFLTGLYMLRQKNLERPIFLVSRIEDDLYYLADKIKERRKRKASE